MTACFPYGADSKKSTVPRPAQSAAFAHRGSVGRARNVTAFAVTLRARPTEPLWANAALWAGRGTVLFLLSAPYGKQAVMRKAKTLAGATALGVVVVALWAGWTL